MKPVKSGHYLKVGFRKNGLWKDFYIHRLVLIAFCGEIENKPCVNHKDENKYNNQLENLEWCTHKYNVNYGNCRKKISDKLLNNKNKNPNMYTEEVRKKIRNTKLGTNNPNHRAIAQYKQDGSFIMLWDCIAIAERTLGITNIIACAKGKQRHAGGYVWKYI